MHAHVEPVAEDRAVGTAGHLQGHAPVAAPEVSAIAGVSDPGEGRGATRPALEVLGQAAGGQEGKQGQKGWEGYLAESGGRCRCTGRHVAVSLGVEFAESEENTSTTISHVFLDI